MRHGGAAHDLQQIAADVGIECCRLAAGIDAPRVIETPWVEGFTGYASVPA